MRTLLDFHATPDGLTDNSDALCRYSESLVANGGGTLLIPDGVFGLGRTFVLPIGVSLVMQPGATLKALPEFTGDVLVETESYAKTNPHWTPQTIDGGILDGSSLPITGIRTIRDRETDIRNITVRNCLYKGIHIGVEQGCEVNLFNVRVQCERGVVALPGSIGIHFEKATDNLVCGGIVIGYETGVRSDSSSNDFQQIHAWNYDQNCRLAICFACNGWNDSWNQCYADSPMNGDEIGYGFYVSHPFNRISNGRVYNNQWVTPDKVIGIFIDAGGTHGTYLGNHFTAQSGHRMRMAFDGNLDSATILGNSFGSEIAGGRVCQIPSGGGGLSAMPELVIVEQKSIS
jgi:hypothetical protein